MTDEYMKQFADTCASHKANRTCDGQCQACPNNISLYGIDVRDAVAIQHSADLRYAQARASLQDADRRCAQAFANARAIDNMLHRQHVMCGFIKMLVWGLFGLALFWLLPYACSHRPASRQFVTPDSGDTFARADAKRARAYGSIDYYPDGEHTCIDRAIAYKLLDPDCRIWYGITPDNKKAHVWIRKNGVDIEPFVLMGPEKYDQNYTNHVVDVTDILMRCYREHREFNWQQWRFD